MYIVRDIFHLKFGHYRDAKALMDEARAKNMFPEAKSFRMLSDFTGDAYRLIMEEGYDTLAVKSLSIRNDFASGNIFFALASSINALASR